MEIALKSIGAQPVCYRISERESRLEGLDSLDATITLCRMEDERYTLEGTLKSVGQTICDRCGRPYTAESELRFSYLLQVGEEESVDAERECPLDEGEIVYLPEPILEVDDILREQLLLQGFEGQRLCSPECKGLCQQCGTDLNREPCACGQNTSSSPFAVLGKFRDKVGKA